MTDPSPTPASIERLQQLFELALDHPAAERASVLRAREPGDPGLCTEVLQLVAIHEEAEQQPRNPLASPVQLDQPGEPDRWLGARIGAYQIVRLIGQGGMGAVYEGQRADDAFRKGVAIKLLHRSAESAQAIERFLAERQILASLNHPNIAALVDGGVTDDGQPYLIMEYIDGQPITRWCDERRLTIRARLKLFGEVCAAVQGAHRSLVVHRDIKPANILVCPESRVKLLDFGIARPLAPDRDTDSGPPTLPGHRSFTPDYAAPEQIR
ncbi:MAG TPA: serine/threonine-protein kinase, partial [Gemmatimonadales bacterium]|nr:serine/threonine-protein kinase [Gemmatimonadales bacterium]